MVYFGWIRGSFLTTQRSLYLMLLTRLLLLFWGEAKTSPFETEKIWGKEMAEEKIGGWAVAANAKWTRNTGQHGYTVIPNLLIWYASQLGIRPTAQAVLFQLLSHWWVKDNLPIVSKARLAEGLGISERQVQRQLRVLEKAGLIKTRFPSRAGRHPHEFKFDGLVKKMQEIAVAHRREKRQQQHRRSKAVKSVGRKNADPARDT